MGLNLTNFYSPNFDINKRAKKSIKFIILHYTGMKNELAAINKLCNPKSKVSSHYFIKNNGDILKMVPDVYQAWHAGKSSWKKFKSLNKNSINIITVHKDNLFGNKQQKFFKFKTLDKKSVLYKEAKKVMNLNSRFNAYYKVIK